MEENVKEPIEATPQKSAVDINFAALENAYGDKPLAEVKTDPIVEEKPVIEEEKPTIETTPEEKLKLETEALATEAKELGLKEGSTKEEIEAAKLIKEETPVIEFKAEDILPNINEPADGTWLKVAKERGLTITEDTHEAYIEAEIAPIKKELEELKANNKIDYFASLKPETAAAFQLMEMGVPQEQILAPLKDIETYLSLTPEQLVRADYEARAKQGEAWTPDLIDAKMEELSNDPTKLKLADAEIRIVLSNQAKAITEERTQLVQQYTAEKEQAAIRQVEQEKTNFATALNTVSKFLDIPINDGVKQAILTKYNQGLYENDFKSASARVEYILHKELGSKVVKELRNTAYQKGRDEITKKQLNIPPVTNSVVGANKVVPVNQNDNNPFAALEKAFGG